MSPITFVLPVLVAFVLVGVYVILRAFLRVRGEPSSVDAALSEVPVSPPQPAAAGLNGRERAAGMTLDRESLDTITRWYSGRECAICKREIGVVSRKDPRPGLLSAASAATHPEIMTWDQVPTGQLKAVLDSHLPVCASCVVADSFRRSFPDRVTDRTDTSARDRAFH